MAVKVDPNQWGLDAALQREQEYHPLNPTTGAWAKRTAALKQTTTNTNELIDRVAETERRLDALPFVH